MSNGLATYRVTLAAEGRRKMSVRGVFIYLKECTFPVEISLRQVETGSKSGLVFKQTIRKGEKWYSATEFDSIEFENTSASDQNTIEIVAGYGDYARELPERISAADFTRSNAVTLVGTGTQEQLVAEEGFRKRLILQARSANNVAGVRVAETAAQIVAGDYFELFPNQGMVYEVKNGFYFQGTAGDIVLAQEEIYND